MSYNLRGLSNFLLEPYSDVLETVLDQSGCDLGPVFQVDRLNLNYRFFVVYRDDRVFLDPRNADCRGGS